jgi:hypothetical protein
MLFNDQHIIYRNQSITTIIAFERMRERRDEARTTSEP